MKKFLLSIVCCLLACVSIHADEVTFNFKSLYGSSTLSSIESKTVGGITISYAKNDAGSAPAFNKDGSLRLYYNASGNGGSATFTTDGTKKITKAVITATTTPTVKYSVDGGNLTSGTWNSKTMTISDISASNTLMIQNANTSNTQLRITEIVLTVESNSSGATKETQTLAFSEDNISINEGESFTAPTLTGAQTTVTYNSSNTGVATVNETTGEVTIEGTGTTTITATAIENENYYSATASYTLTVIKNLENSGTATFDFTDPTSLGLNVPASGTGIDINAPIVSEGITMTTTHGSTATRLWNASGTTGLRFYAGGSITFIVPDGYVITKVSFTGTQSVPEEWNGSAQSVTFNATEQVRLSSAIITYAQGTAVTKQEQILTFSSTEFTIEEGGSFTAPTLSGAQTTVTYSSSNEAVATVDAATGEVTIVGIGTTTITANAAEDETYYAASASYTLTVNPNIAGITLPYMMETKVGDDNYGGIANLPGGSIIDGVEAEDYKSSTAYNSRLKFRDAGDNLVFKLADSPATLSYIIKSNSFAGGTFIVETSVDGSSYTTLKTYNTAVFDEAGSDIINEIHIPLNAEVRYIRWTYTSKVTGNIGLGSIYITKQGDATTMPLTISAAKYATFFSDKAIVMPEGVSGNIVTIDGAQANLTEEYVAGDIVPANTPLLLSAEAGTYDAYFTAATNTQNAENLLKGALTNDVITAPANTLLYIFANDSESGLGFYWQKDSGNGQQVKNMAGKAYLQVPTTSPVQGFRLNLGDTTGITAVESTNANAPVYTLSGVRVNGSLNNLPAGIYIVGGKKVYVK